jgi:hypothetical protein
VRMVSARSGYAAASNVIQQPSRRTTAGYSDVARLPTLGKEQRRRVVGTLIC